nr:PREDICTED: uncharacterized protein LOC108203396 isoform X1 [Daucus carota subsp. sativus]
MSIRFKFRSAVSFDAVDIGERPAISVGELKSKIIAQKNLNLCQGFDLVFSDHLTGQEYGDENYQIPSNSSVIIKRVPAESVSPALLGGQNLQTNDLVEVIPKGPDHNGTKGKLPPEKLEPEVQEHVKLEPEIQENVKLEPEVQENEKLGKAIDPYDLAEKNPSLIPEFRCPICTKVLKEAVMTRCCQRSFCERCICGVLNEKSKCPKCSSDKFKAEDLLPNVSLRLAIMQLLESQIQCSISETALRRYAPDEESGIQANGLSSALTIYQKRQTNVLYASATEKGSNRLLGESYHGELKTGYHPGLADCQGENHPFNLHQNHGREKGENRKVSTTARYRKADRTCYMCDAPNHLIKECPFVNGPHPWLQTGNSMYSVGARPTFAAPYWNNTAYGPMRPFTNLYANHGMMPYNSSMFPVSPVGVSPYMAAITAHSGFQSMAGMAPLAGNRTEYPFRHEDFLKIESCDIRGNRSKEYMMRKQPSDDDGAGIQTNRHNLPKSSEEYLFHKERKNSGSYSGEKKPRRSRGDDLHAGDFDCKAHSRHDRHGKNSRSLTRTGDRKAYHRERSNSGAEDMSNSPDRYVDERHKHRHHKITRNHYERRGHFGSDSNWNEGCDGQKDKRRVYSDEKGFSKKHACSFGSGEESSFSGDWEKRRREGVHIRSSKHAREGTKYTRDELFCRSKMVRRDEDSGKDNYQLKRKRVY